MVIRNIQNIDRNAWNALLEHSSFASVFQSPDYYDFISQSSYYSPFVIAYADDTTKALKAIVLGSVQQDGGKITRFFSRRAIVYAGPLLADDISESELTSLLLALADSLSKKAIYLEFRNFFDYSRYQSSFNAAEFSYQRHLDCIISTPSFEVAFDNFQRRKRRQIRAALRNDVSFIDSPSESQIAEFYELLRRHHLKRARTPVPPVDFFQSLAKSNVGKVILVSFDNKIIAGSAILCMESGVVYHLYVAGADDEYKLLDPSSLSHYSVIRYATDHGYTACDLMGAGSPDVPYGVRDFKQRLGGEFFEFGRNLLILNRPLYRLGSFAVSLFKKL